MNKNQIQNANATTNSNPNIRKPSNTYLKTEFNNAS